MKSCLVGLLILAAVPVWAARADWKSASFKPADCTWQVPSQPTPSKSVINGQQSLFYTSDSAEGRFVVGFTPFAPQIEPQMRRMILSKPGGDGIKHLLDATVAAFAKGGGAKVLSTKYGLDRGLPAEFAVLKNQQTLLNMRVYIHPRRVYMFIAGAGDDKALKFFDSVQIPGVIGPSK